MNKKTARAGLVERFADLPDTRVEGQIIHDRLDIVVLALAVFLLRFGSVFQQLSRK